MLDKGWVLVLRRNGRDRGDQKVFIADGKMMEWPYTITAIEIRRTTVEFREVNPWYQGESLSSTAERPT